MWHLKIQGLPIVILLISFAYFHAKEERADPKLASCQLMKHNVAVFQLNCDMGER
jgi:hypothetical protein